MNGPASKSILGYVPGVNRCYGIHQGKNEERREPYRRKLNERLKYAQKKAKGGSGPLGHLYLPGFR